MASTTLELSRQVLQEKQTKVLPYNIKKNINMFGITGTYEGSGGAGGNIRVFSSLEEMKEAESEAEIDDIGCYFKYTYSYWQYDEDNPDDYSNFVYFPQSVTFLTAITDETIYTYFDPEFYSECLGIKISPTKCEIGICETDWDWDEETDEESYTVSMKTVLTTYTSSDGLTYTYSSGEKNYVLENIDYLEIRMNSITREFLLMRTNYFGGIYQYEGRYGTGEINGFTKIKYTASTRKLTSETTLIDISKIIPCLEYINSQFEPKSYETYLVVIKPNNTVNIYTELAVNGYREGSYIYALNENNIYVASQYEENTSVRKYTLDLNNSTATYTELSLIGTYFKRKCYDSSLTCDDIILFIDIEGKPRSFEVYYPLPSGSSSSNYSNYNYYLNDDFIYHYYPAETQLTISNAYELLPNVTAYGDGGEVTGDGSIYDHLDDTELFKKFWGEENLIFSIATAHKNININQALLSHIGNHGLNEFVKVYDNLIEGCHTGCLVPSSVEDDYTIINLDWAYKYETTNAILKVKNRNNGTINTFNIPNQYSRAYKFYNNILGVISYSSSSSSNCTLYMINLNTMNMTSKVINYDGSYSSSNKQIYFRALYKNKWYFAGNVQTGSTTIRFFAGYVNITNGNITLLLDTSQSINNNWDFSYFCDCGISTRSELLVFWHYRYGSSGNINYCRMKIFNLDTDVTISTISPSAKSSYSKFWGDSGEVVSNTLMYDDGNTIYTKYFHAIRKSDLEEVDYGYDYDENLPKSTLDLKYSYYTDTEKDPDALNYLETKLHITNLINNTTIWYYVPYLYAYKTSTLGIRIYSLQITIEEINNELYIREGIKFLVKLHRVEIADPTDYDWQLVCSVCDETRFIPQFFYTLNAMTPQEYNDALNIVDDVLGN